MITRVEEKLVVKMGAVRDQVSCIDGQLVSIKIIAFEEARGPRSIEKKDQKSVRK